MKASKYKLAIAYVLFTFMGINMNVIAKANVVNSEFLIKQKGFSHYTIIRRCETVL